MRFPEWAVRGRSPAFRGLEDELLSLANTDIPVLITGETGTGKELVARTLHLSSERRRGPFVAVNCAAIPTDLLEADLFGVARGAATGVLERRGAFERASGGVLLLDEIGDMPLRLQAKLLRALQEKEILPVGGESPKHVDARVLSTTNSDIESQVEGGAFRRDLFFRLAGALVRVPSLAERQEDIPALVDRFVRQFLAESEKRIRGVTARTVHALAAARWPGNVRQLEHVVRRLVAVCPDDQVIDYGLLPPWVARAQRDTTSSPKTSLRPADPTAPVPGDASLAVQVEALERHAIASALERARGNRSLAARDLGLSRNGLTLKLRRLGLD